MNGYLFILLTILLTVYGQLIIKWQVALSGGMPAVFLEKVVFLLKLCLNPWIFSGFAAAFLASLCWMAALTRFNLSHAYPFMGMTFVLVLVGSGLFLGETITSIKITGTVLIVLGIIVSSQG